MAATTEKPLALAWAPQRGPQEAFVSCPIYELFYGGARGGGKTDGALGDWLIHAGKYGKKARGLMMRRTYTALEDTIARSHELFPLVGAKWLDQKGTWKMPGGAILRMRYLRKDADAMNYQGHGYTRCYVEELTQFANEMTVRKLHGAMRSAGKDSVPAGFRGTGNPGGPGHTWVKERYITPNPGGWQILREQFVEGDDNTLMERIFIPSKLKDNPALLENDPAYVGRLHMVGSKALVEAWLNGDWDQVEGAFFDCWSSQMVLTPFAIPDDWPVSMSMDWGSARPFSVGWWAVARDDFEHPTDRCTIPKGALVRFAEWYGMTPGQPNIGLKMTAEEVRNGIVDREIAMGLVGSRRPTRRTADPSMFAEDGGPSLAERFGNKANHIADGYGLFLERADNKRVGRLGAMGGWDLMRARMIGWDGMPMVYCFKTCVDSIRTVPAQQHAELNPEDMDSLGEDHAADDWRYECTSRPWQPSGIMIPPKPRPHDYGSGYSSGGGYKTA